MNLFENRELFFALFFAGGTALSVVVYFFIRRFGNALNLVDVPDKERKIHRIPVPKFGGIVIFTSFVFLVIVLSVFAGTDELSPFRMAGFLIGCLVLVVGGILDDRYDLSPGKQIWFPLLAVLIVVLSGTHISFISNPLGGPIILDQYKIFGYPLFGSIFVYLWILGMTYTTKFLDGMDGLVSGISVIAALSIFALSLSHEVNQTSTAYLAIIFAGVMLGFLYFNFHPAKVFLGEGGSTLTGFIIGVLAVISGGKIATALLVLGIPVLDVAWVIVQRIWFGRSPFQGDNSHLHFRLLDIGMTQKQAVLFLYALAGIFGLTAIFLQSIGKLVALGMLIMVMIVVILSIAVLYRKTQTSKKEPYE